MTMIDLLHRFVVPAAFTLLPPKMHTPAAHAGLLAIALQESRGRHRRQIGTTLRLPALSFWQFEPGEQSAFALLFSHRASEVGILDVCRQLRYPLPLGPIAIEALRQATAHNDILAAAAARYLLLTLPQPLPGRDDPEEAYRQYLAAWRPGQPHPDDWPGNYAQAWTLVTGQAA